ncbi:hypothetical protein EXS71_03080 [Candidatus Uhrbacteria bacterium]|nr:hypothetical protein [Candidatus Uhrbacteria bacterium]
MNDIGHALAGFFNRTWKLGLWGILILVIWTCTHPGWLPGVGNRLTAEFGPFFGQLLNGLAPMLILCGIVVWGFKKLLGLGSGGGKKK